MPDWLTNLLVFAAAFIIGIAVRVLAERLRARRSARRCDLTITTPAHVLTARNITEEEAAEIRQRWLDAHGRKCAHCGGAWNRNPWASDLCRPCLVALIPSATIATAPPAESDVKPRTGVGATDGDAWVNWGR